MRISFTCHCGANINFQETALYSKDSIFCPICHEKVSPKFLNQLKEFCVEKNSQYMDVSFSSSPTIHLNNVIASALSICATRINFDRKKEGKPAISFKNREELFDLLKDKNPAYVSTLMFESGIYAYHQALAENFSNIGIDIGEII